MGENNINFLWAVIILCRVYQTFRWSSKQPIHRRSFLPDECYRVIGALGEREGYTLSRSLMVCMANRQTNTFTPTPTGNFRGPDSPDLHVFDPWKQAVCAGGRGPCPTWGEEPQLRSNPEPSCCEVTLLTNEPTCCQTPLIKQHR